MDEKVYATLLKSFGQLTPVVGEIIKSFYGRLMKNPSFAPLFANVDMDSQRTKLIDSLSFVVKNAGRPETVRPALLDLGKSHISYGALLGHYPAIAYALLDSLREGAGERWNVEWEQAWSQAIDFVCKTMQEGARLEYKAQADAKRMQKS